MATNRQKRARARAARKKRKRMERQHQRIKQKHHERTVHIHHKLMDPLIGTTVAGSWPEPKVDSGDP